MLHEIATGERFKMPDSDDEIYGRSFWSGLSHADTSEKIEEIAEEESQSDRLDTLGSVCVVVCMWVEGEGVNAWAFTIFWAWCG